MLTAAVGFWDLLFRFLPCQWFVIFRDRGISAQYFFHDPVAYKPINIMITHPILELSGVVLLLTLQSIALAISLYYLVSLKTSHAYSVVKLTNYMWIFGEFF